ncbi:Uncharacterised protein [Mycobacteroides abscessus]|nr:Uncharacterised protein [Mycobacteroides abscessus]
MDVRDHRNLALAGNLGERIGILLSRAGDTHDVAAGGRELRDLLQGEFTSWVLVVHIDCTETGESLPTPTLPTMS